jgi:hypothetical protein
MKKYSLIFSFFPLILLSSLRKPVSKRFINYQMTRYKCYEYIIACRELQIAAL